MKFLMTLVAGLFVAGTAIAGLEIIYIDGADSIQQVRETPAFKKQHITTKLPVDYWSLIAAVHSDAETFQCEDDDIKKIKVVSPSGYVFYMIYTMEDYCDGGNTLGILLDSQFTAIGEIHDGAFYKNIK
ncbi:hypothetical protein [Bdellovibrio sp. HCB2-146]|uniref:hypothetical protein n=1 Tax=Bdellovibrio sp. HCB2-146 TaxID=3394362 RepID=UPI0039BCEBF8